MPPKSNAKAPAAKPAAAPKQAAKQAPAPAGKKQVAAAPKSQPAPAAPAPKEAPKKVENTGVYVKGIGAGDDLDALKKVFRSAGNILASRRRGDKYCLFWYDSQSAAKKAVETFHNKNVHGSKVSVQMAKAAMPRPRAEYCKTIFIGNVSPAVTRAQLRQAVASYGDVTKIRTYSTGHAFVYFKDVKSAVKAKNEMHGKKVLNRFVEVKLSVRTKDKDAKCEKSARKRSLHFSEHRKWVKAIGKK